MPTTLLAVRSVKRNLQLEEKPFFMWKDVEQSLIDAMTHDLIRNTPSLSRSIAIATFSVQMEILPVLVFEQERRQISSLCLRV